jgi:hypothetical protein
VDLDAVGDNAVLEPHVVQRRDPATHHLLEQGPGHAEGGSTPVASRAVAPGLVDPGAGAVDPSGTQPFQLVVDPGEPVDQQVQPGGQQQVQVLSLRHVTARRRRIGQPLPLDDDDLAEDLREDTRGQEPRHARTDHGRGRHPESLADAARQEKSGDGVARRRVPPCNSTVVCGNR